MLTEQVCSSGRTTDLFLGVSGSDLKQDTDYVDIGFPWFLSVHPTKCRIKAKLGHDYLNIRSIVYLFVIHIITG
jgi:hypothetical protein